MVANSNVRIMAPTARSLILDLLSTLRRGTMPVSALVEAGELFGIAGNSTRVALARLRTVGQVERDERGRYRLGAVASPVAARVGSWRRIADRSRSWSGGWIGVHTGSPDPGLARRQRRRRTRALELLGLRPLQEPLYVRPDNLRGGIEALRTELVALGLPRADLVFEMRSLDALSEARARRLWDVEALHAGYRAMRAQIRASSGRLPRMPPGKAMVESFMIGGAVLRQLAFDPLLPDAIASEAERTSLVEAMRDYDRLGRALWAEFLARWDVPHLRAPVDTRAIAGTARRVGKKRHPRPGVGSRDDATPGLAGSPAVARSNERTGRGAR
jgi:phenylacetic acid degradation operon negative regulatory protein